MDKREGRAVAIKRFDIRGASTWKSVELAEREVRVLSSLKHPKLPAYVDHFEEGGALYLVMEKIEGESLAAIRQRGARLGEADVLRLLADASEVLEYLHGRAPPVVHRDLKPGNVIRRSDGSFAFVDFGAVRDKLRPEGGSTVVGTFGYMAPEQFQGRALAASDVYSMGATAIAMLTGVEPEALPHKGLAIDVREALRGRVSRELTSILTQMVEPDPDRRPGRIAPLLTAWRTRTSPPSWGEAQKNVGRRSRKEARRAARRARREAKRLRVRARAAPWPVALGLSLAIALAIFAVTVSLQVIVPVVLQILSAFFARRALGNAADAVRQGGDRAVTEMRSFRRWALGWPLPFEGAAGPDERVRVGASPDAEVRVADGEGEPIGWEDAEDSGHARRGSER